MKVGFIGLGNVGGKLAGSLLRNGFDLHVYDADCNAAKHLLEKGATWAESSGALAATCDAVITCLPSPAISAQVMEGAEGILTGISAGKFWLEMSTTEAEEVKRLGALVEAKGAFPLDSPVSGGCHRASTGNISIFTGGQRQAFEQVMPLLSAMGRRIVHTGPLGSASVLKVITNYLAGLQLVATGEALMVAKKAGMDLAVAFEAIKASSGNSFVHETESQVILNGSYNINFTMDLAVKDMTLFNHLGSAHGVPLELSPLCLSIIEDGLKRYGARAWSSQVVKRLEDDCQESLRADGFPACLVDDEAEEAGTEIVVANRKSFE